MFKTMYLTLYFFSQKVNLLKEKKKEEKKERVLKPLLRNLIYGDHEMRNLGLIFRRNKRASRKSYKEVNLKSRDRR